VYLGEHLNKRILHLCHSPEDKVKRLSNDDMKEFISDVLEPIVKRYY
jgi:hypothetical protein